MKKKIAHVIYTHRKELYQIAVIAIILILPDICGASTGGADGAYRSAAGDMPWSKALEKIVQELTGPIPKFIGVFAVALTGAMLAFGEMGHALKKLLQIVFGISIALSATMFIGWMGTGTNGLAL